MHTAQDIHCSFETIELCEYYVNIDEHVKNLSANSIHSMEAEGVEGSLGQECYF